MVRRRLGARLVSVLAVAPLVSLGLVAAAAGTAGAATGGTTIAGATVAGGSTTSGGTTTPGDTSTTASPTRTGGFTLTGGFATPAVASPPAALGHTGAGSVQGQVIELTRGMPSDEWTSLNLTTTFAPGVSLDSDPVPFVDPVTGYQNAYAVDLSGHLIEFTRFPAGFWTTTDLTSTWSGAALGGGDAEPFVDAATHNQSVLVTGTGGDLLDYQRAANGSWVSLDVSALSAGPPIIGTAAPFVDPVTGFQNAYGTSVKGHLFEYTRLADGTWVSLDLTAVAHSLPIVGAPQPFVDPLTGFQNVYAGTEDGDLVEFTRLTSGAWISLDLNDVAPNSPSIVDDVAPFVDPLTGYQNVYAETLFGQLVEYTRFPNGSWQSLQIVPSGVTPGISGDPVPYVDGSAQTVFAEWGTELVQYVRQPNGSWVKDAITAGPATPDIDATPELIVDPVTHLLNAYFLDEVRVP